MQFKGGVLLRQRLLLVGAGHAHLEVINQYGQNPNDDVDVCLLSPSKYQYYSGMLSGYVEGLYEKEEIRINVEKMAEKAGVNFIKKRADFVNPKRKKLHCEGGAVYPFDMISFDIGSNKVPDQFQYSFTQSVKPYSHFVDQISSLREAPMPLIIGGGAAGSELALALQAYKNNHNAVGQVRLVTSTEVLSSGSKGSTKKLRSILKEAGVQLWEHEKVKELYDDYVLTHTNNRIRHSDLLWMSGPQADEIFKRSSLQVDKRGFALVQDTLQFEDYDFMFGAGDCVTMSSHPDLDKSGVYAVKQGPVLFENLLNFVKGAPLQPFKPQKQALYILSTGNKKGLFLYGKLKNHSFSAWKLKNKIDESFIRKYQ
ncbi:FAD-dependent oxidoreductase [Halobacillus sp. Marseille-Q1614]|uniref:FAD-dependent oxidoreductase n=1 Tax=Halobacillus sp. Marseille-Q1614 TaxID=2709134 RepID=UPI0020C46E11|nr:FAD-dependent oxidoreductase [Halobacillus sp. Marseille-Q1614]